MIPNNILATLAILILITILGNAIFWLILAQLINLKAGLK